MYYLLYVLCNVVILFVFLLQILIFMKTILLSVPLIKCETFNRICYAIFKVFIFPFEKIVKKIGKLSSFTYGQTILLNFFLFACVVFLDVIVGFVYY